MEQSCYDSYMDISTQILHGRKGASVWASSTWEAEQQPQYEADTVPQALDYADRVEYFIPKLHVVSSGLSQSMHYVNLPSSHTQGLTGARSSFTGICCR